MWEDLRQDLQDLDNQLIQDAESFDESLPLDTLTTHLRGFVQGDNGVPVLSATENNAAERSLDPTSGDLPNEDIASLRGIVAATDDALAGLDEFEDDDYDEDINTGR